MAALADQWQFLVQKSAEKSQKLKEANKQQNFNTGIKDFDFWLSEVAQLTWVASLGTRAIDPTRTIGCSQCICALFSVAFGKTWKLLLYYQALCIRVLGEESGRAGWNGLDLVAEWIGFGRCWKKN